MSDRRCGFCRIACGVDYLIQVNLLKLKIFFLFLEMCLYGIFDYFTYLKKFSFYFCYLIDWGIVWDPRRYMICVLLLCGKAAYSAS